MPRTLSPLSSLATLARPDGPSLPLVLPEGDSPARRTFPPSARLNFAQYDPLGLAAHPAVRRAALDVPRRLAPDGEGGEVAALEDALARFLRLSSAATFATGPDAIRATLRTLVAADDLVILDAGSDPATFETVRAIGARVLRTPPGSVDAVERRLRRLSRDRVSGKVHVIVPAVGALTSVNADLAELSALTADYGAQLVVDASQDLGLLAPGGRGVVELQGCLGRPDVILGSFAPAFGATGGFAALRDPAQARRLRASVAQGRDPGLDRVQAAILLASLAVVDSAEGRRRRSMLHGAVLRLRNHLMADGFPVLGQPSAVVAVRLPHRTAVARAALLSSAGPVVPLVTAPLVARHAPRWLIRLTADHQPADIDDLADLIRDVSRSFGRPVRAFGLAEAPPQP
jgi:glycine C-acetyltransferase